MKLNKIQKKILDALSTGDKKSLKSVLVNLNDSEFGGLLNELSTVYQDVNANRDAYDPILIADKNKTHSVLIAPDGTEVVSSKKGAIPASLKKKGIKSRNKTNQRQLTSEDIIKSGLDGNGGFGSDYKKSQNKGTGGAISWD